MLKSLEKNEIIIISDSDESENKENEISHKQLPIKSSHRKRDRHALESIPQNVQDIKGANSRANINDLPIIAKAENTQTRKINKSLDWKKSINSSDVEYALEQQILTFKSPRGKRSIQTQEISPVVDEEAPGPRQSLRNLPATRPPRLQRTNSRTAIKRRIAHGPYFASLASEYHQYKRRCIQNMKESSWMYVIDRIFLPTLDPIMKNRNHAIISLINRKLPERCCVLLNGIRIFDLVLAAVFIPRRLYVLVLATAFWISAKLDNSNFVRFKDLCNDAFTKEHCFNMERKILHFLNYNLNMLDPTLIVDYICMQMERKQPATEKNTILFHSAYFFLELFALDSMFTTTDPIIMAVAAVRNSMKLLPEFHDSINTFDRIISVFKFEVHDYSTDEKQVESCMIFLFARACDGSHIFHDVFQKYNTAHYYHVTKELRNNTSREISF